MVPGKTYYSDSGGWRLYTLRNEYIRDSRVVALIVDKMEEYIEMFRACLNEEQYRNSKISKENAY